jgi:uncharacterized repeat protein (TIGR01451 family)
MMRRNIRSVAGTVATLVLAGLMITAPVARADVNTFSNTTAIPIADKPCTGVQVCDPGKGNPYPSNITVSGMAGTVTNVTATLNNVTHTFPDDIDVLLVGPAGQNLVLVSDAGGGTPVNNFTVTFDDAAAGSIPDSGAWITPSKPVNYGTGADVFPSPAPAPSAATTLATFNGTNPNGTWSLYAVDDSLGDTGTIGGGWSLTITTNASAAATTTAVGSSQNPSTTGNNVTFTATVTSGGNNVGANGTVTFKEGATTLSGPTALNASGQASFTTNTLTEGSHVITAEYSGTASLGQSSGSVTQVVNNATVVNGTQFCNTGPVTVPDNPSLAVPYPSNIFVTGQSTSIAKLTATLKGVTHPFPDDLDVLLVGPTGQNLILVSDAGGNSPVNNFDVTFDDAAVSSIPDTGAWITPSMPVNYGAGADAFPAPAPAPSAATTLAAFNGTDPNGTWGLYVVDDSLGSGPGSISGGWCLNFTFASNPDLVVTKSDSPDPVVAGNNITYSIAVSNQAAGSTATSVTLSDPIPANTTFVSRVVPGGWSCAAQAVGSTDPLSCTRATLTPADGAQNFTLVVRVNLQTPSATTINNQATVGSTPTDTGPGANTASTTTAVTFAPSLPAVVASSVNWTLHSALATAGTDVNFTLGTSSLVPLTGDWDGNGSRTPGFFKGGVFYLSNSTGPTPTVDTTFTFGDPRGFPVAGDFNGDGTDDVAVYRDGQWQVRLSTGVVLPTFSFGPGGSWPATVPVAGDWDGDGIDGIGTYTYASGTWNLNNTADGSAVDIGPFVFWSGSGTASYPVVGDWDGDGIDTVGVRSAGSSWVLNNQNDSSPPDVPVFTFGAANALPLTWRPL